MTSIFTPEQNSIIETALTNQLDVLKQVVADAVKDEEWNLVTKLSRDISVMTTLLDNGDIDLNQMSIDCRGVCRDCLDTYVSILSDSVTEPVYVITDKTMEHSDAEVYDLINSLDQRIDTYTEAYALLKLLDVVATHNIY